MHSTGSLLDKLKMMNRAQKKQNSDCASVQRKLESSRKTMT